MLENIYINVHELSEIIGEQPHVIKKLSRIRAIPVGTPKGYILKDTVNSYIKYLKEKLSAEAQSDLEALSVQRSRLIKIQADRQYLKLQQEKEELLPIDLVVSEWANLIKLFHSKLSAFGAKAAPLVYSANSVSEAETILNQLISDILNELSNPFKDKSINNPKEKKSNDGNNNKPDRKAKTNKRDTKRPVLNSKAKTSNNGKRVGG